MYVHEQMQPECDYNIMYIMLAETINQLSR